MYSESHPPARDFPPRQQASRQPAPMVDSQRHAVSNESSTRGQHSEVAPEDLTDWIRAKRDFREAAHRILSHITLKVSVYRASLSPTPSSYIPSSLRQHSENSDNDAVEYDALRMAHADAGIALLVATLRVLLDHNEVGTTGSLPIDDFSRVAHDAIPGHSLAISINEDYLKLQLDAVGIIRAYLEEERRVLTEMQASWLRSTHHHVR
ncbi:hypothetical protein C8Q76DRAFT_795170 [Earliella scabrosa]|nr:hypothetical protein C8Q76DRAFT_795170 [Earliella scabrosa]